MSNLLDRLLSYLSPTAGARRARSRAVERVMNAHGRRSYDGASSGRRTGGWSTGSTSANTELQGSLINLRNRARDLVRNDPFAARAVQGFAGNLVGHGIVPSPKHKTKTRSDLATLYWQQWGETTACDFHGRHDFYGLQAQIARAIFESGEVLIRRMRLPASAPSPIPLQLQVLESDYLDAMRNNVTTAQGGYILQGVEHDGDGRVVAYWLFKRHPGDVGLPLGGLVSERVDASEIQHIFRADRPGQNRGASWFAPVLLKLRDFNEYEDAQLMRQKIAACFSVFTMDAEPPVDPDGTGQVPLTDRIEPGMIMNLTPGKDVKFAAPPGVDGYGEYSKTVLRSIAAGLSLTYELLTGDLSNMSFSSGRLGWLEFHRSLQQWTWGMFIPQVCDPVWGWFIEAARLKDPKVDEVTAEWAPPKREMIDPEAEVKAAIIGIRAGLNTRSAFIRSQGDDPARIDAELAADKANAAKLGLVLDSEPEQTTQIGMLQMEPKPAAPDDPSPKGEKS